MPTLVLAVAAFDTGLFAGTERVVVAELGIGAVRQSSRFTEAGLRLSPGEQHQDGQEYETSEKLRNMSLPSVDQTLAARQREMCDRTLDFIFALPPLFVKRLFLLSGSFFSILMQ